MPQIYSFYSTSIYLEFTLTFTLLSVTLPSCSGCRRFPTTARGHLSCWWGLRWIWEMTATLWRNWPRTNSEPWRATAERNWLGSSGPSNMWSAQLSHRYKTRSGFGKYGELLNKSLLRWSVYGWRKMSARRWANVMAWKISAYCLSHHFGK